MGSHAVPKQPTVAPAPAADHPPPARVPAAFDGNGARARLFRMARASGSAEPSPLVVAPPDDELEREADRVADAVVRMADPAATPPAVTPAVPALRTKCAKCEDEEVRRLATDGGPAVAPPEVHDVLAGPGRPLDPEVRAYFEPRFGADFSAVRVHDGPAAAASAAAVRARAYAAGGAIAFAAGQYAPHTAAGRTLLAHELAHVVQDGGRPAAAGLRRQAVDAPPQPESRTASTRDEYQLPGTRETYRVGDAAGSWLLLDIREDGGNVVFRAFNFETGAAREMPPRQWSTVTGAAFIGLAGNAGIRDLGRQLTPAQWRGLWPNPMPQLLKMYEAGQLALTDEAVLTGYKGMVRGEAARALDENERAIDEVLGAPDRVGRLQEYATGLREASVVRDALEQRGAELNRRLAAQHSFTFGLPKAGTGPNTVERLNIHRDLAGVRETLDFWLAAFPLLTRLRTDQIAPAPVEATLREIKGNIAATRGRLTRGDLDPMTLEPVRARLAGGLGPKAAGVVQAEDRSRSWWAFLGAAAGLAAGVAVLFLPGGVFLSAAIGIALAGREIANAAEVGQAANTGLHVDDGLMAQWQASAARFGAVLSTVFAVLGAAAAGFRVLRVAKAVQGLGRVAPELAAGERVAAARVLADDPELLAAITRMAPGDAAVGARVAEAVRQAAGDPVVLRAGLAKVARFAEASKMAPALVRRAEEYHSVLDTIAQNQRTTAVLDTTGSWIVGGGVRDLSPAQRALRQSGEILAKLPGEHAEVTVLREAASRGLTPRAIGTTRDFCPACIPVLKGSGATITGPRTAVWE